MITVVWRGAHLGFFALFPLPELLKQALSVTKGGFITLLFQRSMSSLEAVPQFFLSPLDGHRAGGFSRFLLQACLDGYDLIRRF